ncbi:Mitochondrial ATPase complex subunit atp10 [Coemansia sp. Benny D115]|nr:Mitochondrial ATPase complex subunit atp10 [Coemansia sp. Benny D115]
MNLFQSVAIASRPCLTQVLRQRSIHSSAALLSDKPPPKTQEAPQEQQEPQGTAPQSAQETDKAEEKIEYIGNTRFPRPRPKPRKTIQPGEAVGQTKPAGKVEHQTFKEQWDQKWRDILSPEKNLETRARIIREIGESHWQNILDLRNNGDKLFQAPTSLISVKGARYLPNLEGRTLAGVDTDIVDLCKGKTTLLTVEFTKFAEKHTNSFIGLFEKAMEGRENVQVVQVNIEENWAKAAVLRMCLPYVRRNIPKNRHATYLVHYGDVEGLRNKMGIANPLIGYVFLVDPKTRIRWYANGEAVQSEGATMLALSEELIRQAKQ